MRINPCSQSLDIIIPSYNTAELLKSCLRTLLRDWNSSVSHIIVVDNGSTDASAAMIKNEFQQVSLIESQQNKGFAWACNRGISQSSADYLLLLNSDTRGEFSTIRQMLTFMEQNPQVGACGPRLMREDGTIQPYAFGKEPTLARLCRRNIPRCFQKEEDWSTNQTLEVDWVSGTSLLLRGKAVIEIGKLDERFFMYFEDVDYCLRLRKAGWKVMYYPAATVFHLGGRSYEDSNQRNAIYFKSLKTFYRKHYGWWAKSGLFFLWLANRSIKGTP